MPFKSKAQQRFMFANKPKGVDLKEWAAHTDFGNLPEKVAFFASEKMAMAVASDMRTDHWHLPDHEPGAAPSARRPPTRITTKAELDQALRYDRSQRWQGPHQVMSHPEAPEGTAVLDPSQVEALRKKLAFFATEKLASLVPPTNDILNIMRATRSPEQIYRAHKFQALLRHPDPAVRQQGQDLLRQFNEKSTAVGHFMTRTGLESMGFRPKTAGVPPSSEAQARGQQAIREMDEAQLRKLAQESPSPQRYTFLLELQRRRRSE